MLDTHPEKSTESLRTPVHVRSCGTPVRRRPRQTSNGSLHSIKNLSSAPNGLCPEVYYCPEAILAIIYTSGTTGEAKGVMLTAHECPVERLLLKLLDTVPAGRSLSTYRADNFTAPISRRCSPPRLLALCRLQRHALAADVLRGG